MSRWVPLAGWGAGEYQCRHCDEQYEVQHHVCPNCRSFSVDATADVTRDHETSYL